MNMKTLMIATALTMIFATPVLSAEALKLSFTAGLTPSWNIPLDGRATTNGLSLVGAVSTPLDEKWRVGLEGGVYASLNKLGEFRPRASVSARYGLDKSLAVSLILGGNTNPALSSQTYSLLLAPAYKLDKNWALSCALGPSLSMAGSKYVGVGLVVAPRLTYVF